MNNITITFPSQDPNDELVYELTLGGSGGLIERIAPLTITACTWDIIPIGSDVTPLQIHSHSEAPDFSVLRVRLGEGSLGNRYVVRAGLTLSDGQRMHIAFYVAIDYTSYT
jgi:hypothetical protein